MENTLNSQKKGKYYHCIKKIPYIVQMFIIELRKIIPLKLSGLMVMHEGGKLSRVGELSLAEG